MTALTHAILIEGGDGKRRMAKALELLKEHFADDPAAAAKLDGGIFEDLIVIEPEEGKDITVSRIEELICLFKQKPLVGPGKACIIPCGERMNEHAQNKLLKLLEEPVIGDVIIILSGNAQMLLPTVRSRLMRIWLGYEAPASVVPTEDLRNLTAALVYGKGAFAEAAAILTRYEGSREEAAAFLGDFQLFLRALTIGRISPVLAVETGVGGLAAESAGKVKQKHADRMREGVLLAEKALTDIERGDRVKYALRGMALSMRAGCM